MSCDIIAKDAKYVSVRGGFRVNCRESRQDFEMSPAPVNLLHCDK